MVNLEPVIGHEQGRTRPVIVVSIPDFYDLTGNVLIVPITSKIKNYGLTIPIKATKASRGIHGLALCQHLRSIDINARVNRLIGTCTSNELSMILDTISSSLYV